MPFRCGSGARPRSYGSKRGGILDSKRLALPLAKGADFNAQGGKYGNALQAASSEGHEKVVQMLLDKGADVNAQGGLYGNALQAATSGGHEKVVQLLLDKGARRDFAADNNNI